MRLDLANKKACYCFTGVSTLYILTCLALGLLVSTIAQTQQAAMTISLVGMMLPTLMLSGYLFPIENMPLPLRVISNIVPAKWFYIIIKSVMLKGQHWSHIWKEASRLFGMMTFFPFLTLRNFKSRLE